MISFAVFPSVLIAVFVLVRPLLVIARKCKMVSELQEYLGFLTHDF